MEQMSPLSRRRLLRALAATGASALFCPQLASPQPARVLKKPIPSTGEELPAVGLGSWITFNVGNDPVARDACAQVMGAFFDAGGRLIDSSPMYGSSQDVIGYGRKKLGAPERLFAADKVWISSGARGPAQIEASRRLWGVPKFDLLQVHNLLSWEAHLRTLAAMKAEGQVRTIGITTSEGRRHRDFEQIMRKEPLDFIQVTYNVLDREVEDRILPLARDRGMAVIINRPFREGELTKKLARNPLPSWAAEIDCANWAQVLLKFIVAHPAVTCAIPATSRVDHVRENMGASYGRLPDAAMRARIVAHVEKL
jgi:diketogulonate reductase-like aldo/keto reductase